MAARRRDTEIATAALGKARARAYRHFREVEGEGDG
jgi:hypothetical protein